MDHTNFRKKSITKAEILEKLGWTSEQFDRVDANISMTYKERDDLVNAGVIKNACKKYPYIPRAEILNRIGDKKNEQVIA